MGLKRAVPTSRARVNELSHSQRDNALFRLQISGVTYSFLVSHYLLIWLMNQNAKKGRCTNVCDPFPVTAPIDWTTRWATLAWWVT